MVLREIRTNAKNLIDGATDAAEQFGNQWADFAKGAAEGYCDLYSKAPQFLFNSPAGGFAQGAMNNLCSNREGFEPPDANFNEGLEDSLDFSGGQCDGDEYRITMYKTACRPDVFDEGEIDFNTTVTGPITSIYTELREPNGTPTVFIVAIGKNGQKFEKQGVSSDSGYEISPNPLSPGDCQGRDTPSIVHYEVFEIENIDNPADDCGDPEPQPPEQWDDPDPDPPETDIDININLPDGYKNFPDQTINIKYNPDNRTYEGDKFTIKLEPPDLIVEYDDEDPPDFLKGGLPQGLPKLPDVSDFIPEGLGDRFKSIPGFLRNVFDKVDDFIPTPIPGVSIGDLLDLLNNILDNVEDEQESEPIDQVTVPYYDCEQEQFSSYTWEVVRSSWNNEQVETLQETANNAKLWCDEPNLIVGYPDWWAVRAGANRPQIVQIFRKDGTRNYHSLVIPNYSVEPDPETAAISEYQSGNLMGRETLTDNSTLLVYAIDQAEAERVLDEMASWVDSTFRASPPNRTFQIRQGHGVEESTRIPRVVEIWKEGRKTGSAPDKAWKCPPFNEPTP